MSGPFPTKKISNLTAADIPLSGDEELEVVQIGNSRRVRVRDFVLPTDSIVTVSDMHGSLPGSRHLVDSAQIKIVDGGAGGTLQFQLAGSIVEYTDLQTLIPAAGTSDNVVIDDLVGFVDVDTAAGDINITGIVALFDGQKLWISNIGVNILALQSLNGGSSPENQFRMNSDLSLLQNMTVQIRYSQAIGKWLVAI